MRIFLAGASGVIGVRLVPLLIADGHVVAGMTRTAGNAGWLRDLGAEPVVCDVYDLPRLRATVAAFSPDLVMHQLTDLPDNFSDIRGFGARNVRIRDEGTRNLLDAAAAAGCERFVAQSIAWELPGKGGEAMVAFERQVLDVGGVVIRYGQLYGPDTYYPDTPPPPPRIAADDAARATVALLDAEPGVVEVVERG